MFLICTVCIPVLRSLLPRLRNSLRPVALPWNAAETRLPGGAGHVSGTYPNLFCSHPPFQIDGNFGGAAGISEMLLQSHEGFINPLPALPSEWSEGSLRGFKVRGGATVALKWKDGKLTDMKVRNQRVNNCDGY